MRVEEKITALEKMAVAAAEAKKRQAADEMDGRFKSMVDEAVRDEERKAGETVRAERYKIEREMNKRLVDASGGAKREFITWRDGLTEDLLTDVLQDLRLFTSSPEYEKFLADKIKAAAQTGKYEAVQLTPEDMRYAEAIETASGLKAEQAPDDFIGGFRLISAGRRAVSDHTLAGRFNEQRLNFSLMANADR